MTRHDALAVSILVCMALLIAIAFVKLDRAHPIPPHKFPERLNHNSLLFPNGETVPAPVPPPEFHPLDLPPGCLGDGKPLNEGIIIIPADAPGTMSPIP